MFKGLGFAAGYLGGIAKADTFGQIIDIAESFAPDDWREFLKEIQFSQPDEFFLFDHDPQTGMSSPTEINPEYRKSLAHPPRSKEVTLTYRVSRLVHKLAFTRGQGLWGLHAAAVRALGQKARPLGSADLRRGKGLEAPLVRLPGLR